MSPTEQRTPALPGQIRKLIEAHLGAGDLELPFLPGAAMQVMDLCNDERCDARQISDLISRDQSLASHVLKVSNSAAYAPKEPIVSLQQAISRLGISTVCEITLAVSLKGRVFRVPGYQTKIRNMWIHSAATAAYSKEVARHLRHNVEGAFLCGLLHDAGMPLVMQLLIDIAKARTDKPVPTTLIDAAMNEFHADLGARMVEVWGLSEWMADAVRYHHDYQDAGEHRKDAMITRLADMLCDWALDEHLGEEDFPSEDPMIAELGIYGDDLMKLLGERARILQVIEAFL